MNCTGPLLVSFLLSASAALAESSDLGRKLGHDPRLRMAQLLTALSTADEAACAAWAAETAERPSSNQREVEKQKIVEAWARLAPRKALAHVQSLNIATRFKTPLLESVARGWARYAPAEAWEWSRTEWPPESGDLPKAVIESIDPEAAELALGWTRDLAQAAAPGDTSASDLAFAFFQSLVAAGRSDLYRELIEKFPAGDLRNQLLFSITERLAAYRLSEATDWAVRRQGREDAFYPLAGVAVKRTELDPVAALAWASTLEAGTVRAKVINVVAAQTVARRPVLAEADRILSALSLPAELQAAHAAFAQTEELVRLAPARFLDAAWQIEDSQLRRVSLLRGYSYWASFDAKAAEQHLGGSDQDRAGDRAAVRAYLQGGGP